MTKHPRLIEEAVPDPDTFAHPGDAIDDAAAAVEPMPELLAGEQAREIFRLLFTQCLPDGKVYRGGRRWKAGYNRMVALAYLTAPEVFLGMKQYEVARQLKVDERIFRRLLREVEATLHARVAATARRSSRNASK